MPRLQLNLTTCMAAICGILFIGSVMDQSPDGWEKYERWGNFSAERLWDGAWWGYITSAFIHFDLIHLAFNVYWLLILGQLLEREIGTLKLGALVLTAAVVTSGFQFVVSGDTGCGFSGVLYCFFGFMWQARRRYESFGQVITRHNVEVFLGWLVLCIVLTYLDVWSIGNAAHFSGLVLGVLLGRAAVRRPIAGWYAGSVAMLAISIVPLFWMPHSIEWVSYKADCAFEQNDPQSAIDWLTRAIHMDPTYAWAYYNRGCAYADLNQTEASGRDFETAHQLDPSLFEEAQDDGQPPADAP